MVRLFISILFLVQGSVALATPVAPFFELSGELLQPGTSTPIVDNALRVKVSVLGPTGSCVIYEEEQQVATSSLGLYRLQVGSATGDGKRTVRDRGNTMAQVFQNTVAINGRDEVGSNCSYTPSSRDKRRLRLTLTPSSTGTAQVLSPDLEMGSLGQALVAETVGGYGVNQLALLGAGDLTQANLQSVFATGNAAKLTTLLTGNPANVLRSDASSVTLPPLGGTPSTPQAGQIWYDSGTIKFWNGTSEQTLGVSGAGITSLVAGTGLNVGAGPGGTITTAGTLNVDVGTAPNKIVQLNGSGALPAVSGANLTNLNASNISGGTLGGTVAINTGGTLATSSTLSVGGNTTLGGTLAVTGNTTLGGTLAATGNITTSGNLQATGSVTGASLYLFENTGAGPNSVGLRAPTTVGTSYVMTLPAAAPSPGQALRESSTPGVLEWYTPSSGTVTSVGGTAPITVGGTAPAPVIGIATADSSTTGALTSTDWNTFNNKLGTALTSGLVWVGNGSNIATPRSLRITDITSASTGPWLTATGGCPAGEVLTYQSPADNLACAAFVITSAQVGTALGYTAANPANVVAKAGDTMTGALNLPTNGFAVGTNQLVVSGGNVGIGTTVPENKLHINGGISIFDNSTNHQAMFRDSEVYGFIESKFTNDTAGYVSLGAWDNVGITGARSLVLQELGGNVGVGTTSPETKLHVSGGNILLDNTQNLAFKNSGGSAYQALQVDSSNNLNIGSTQFSGNLNLYASGAAPRMTVLGSNGNVGIGTTSPLSTLDLGSNSAILSMTNNSAIMGNLYFDGDWKYRENGFGGAIKFVNPTDGGGIGIYTVSVNNSTGPGTTATPDESVRIVPSGNVGIGITNPTATLQLKAGNANAGTAPLKLTSGVNLTTPENGAFEYDGTNLYFTSGGVRRTISSTASGVTTNISNITNTGGSVTVTPSAGNSLIVDQTTVSTSISTGALIVNGGAGVAGALNVGGNIVGGANITASTAIYSPLLYGGTTASQNITIDSTSHGTKGAVLIAPAGGNVGIGTTSPSGTLHTYKAANSRPVFESGSGINYLRLKSNNGGGNYGSAIEFYDISTNSAHIASVASGGLRFGTAGTERVTIDVAGNVGIGTLGPSNKLQVSSTFTDSYSGVNAILSAGINIENSNAAATFSSLRFRSALNSADAAVALIPGGAANESSLAFITENGGGGIEAARIDKNGSLGIGTANPLSRLHAHGSILSTGGAATAGNGAIEFSDNGNGDNSAGSSIFGQAGGLSLSAFFAASNTAHLHISAAGNVGIGTTNPTTNLQVAGGISSLANPGSFQTWGMLNDSNTTLVIQGGASSGSGGNIELGRAGDVILDSSFLRVRNLAGSSTSLTVDNSTGNVGIGSTSPLTSLDVNGHISQPLNSYLGSNLYWTGTGWAYRGNGVGGLIKLSDSGVNGVVVGVAPSNASGAGAAATVTNAFAILPSGNVGIGTIGPTSKLDIRGTNAKSGSTEIIGRYLSSDVTDPLVLEVGMGNNAVAANRYISLRVNEYNVANRSLVLQPSGGNVGIGTTSAATTLHLAKSAASTEIIGSANNPAIRINNNNSTALNEKSEVQLGISNGLGFATVTALYSIYNAPGDVGSSMALSTQTNLAGGPVERMRITHSGNVGIGTTNPGTRLDVAGGIRALSATQFDGFAVGNGSNTVAQLQGASASNDNGTLVLRNSGTIAVHLQASGLSYFNNGNVGIGTTTPDERLVVFNGSTTGKYTTGGWTHSSDARLKRDVQPLENSLAQILKLQGVRYTFTNDPEQTSQIGFIAQQVEPIFPEVVKTDAQGFKSMIYGNLVAPLVEAVKALYAGLISVKREVAALKHQQQDKIDRSEFEAKLRAKDLEIQALKDQLRDQEAATKARFERLERQLNQRQSK